jgi:hypothetical protein
MSNENDLIKVTDAEAVEWVEGLSDAEKVELKRRALERRAVELLQPEEKEPNWAAMDEQTFLKVRRVKYGY